VDEKVRDWGGVPVPEKCREVALRWRIGLEVIKRGST
jgi:hypothetical protein